MSADSIREWLPADWAELKARLGEKASTFKVKKELAAKLGVSPSAIYQYLGDYADNASQPTADKTIQLLNFLREAELNPKNPARVEARAGKEKRRNPSQNENQSNRKKL